MRQICRSGRQLQRSRILVRESVTEWGLFAYGSTLPAVTNLTDAETGSPFTAGSATTGHGDRNRLNRIIKHGHGPTAVNFRQHLNGTKSVMGTSD